jgi:Leucine-rich repeat (LRR) protein
VRVSGENLDLITASSIAGTNASFRRINGVLFVKIPADASTGGALPVGGALTFTSLGGISTTSAAIVNAALASGIPFIAGFSPTSGGAGTVITVTGANFTRVTDAYVGNVPVESFIINSPTQMTLTLGTQATAISVGSITLVGPFGSTSAQTGFIFTSSLAGDMQALERALTLVGLGINDVVIEQTDNRISGVRINDKALNMNLDALVRALGTLTQLRSLDLSNSGLTGAIPAALARFTRLENLNLSRNRLTGAIPTDVICGYPNLRILDMSRNALEGTIPTCLATLGKVRVLNLSENRFTGGLPKELGTMQSLEELWVNNNRLSGNLPPEFGEPLSKTAKTTVQLQNAQTLRLLDVSANEFSGTLPAAWGGIRSLQYLNLSNNRLTGALPQSIVNWDALETLRLGNNRFTGQIPALTTTALKTLSLENNAFTGRLPEVLGRATRLRVLNAQNNLFSQVPLIVAVVRMDTLNLSGNRLEFGSLETNIGARSFGYAPQDSIGNGGDTVLRSGSRFVLASGIGGQNTHYQWLRGNIMLPNATAATLTLESAQSFQSGQYVCRASNSRLPELSINTRAMRVVVTGAEAVLPQVMLLFPPVRAENIAVRPRLVWSAVEGAEQYELLLARDVLLRQGVVRRIVSASAAPSYRLTANDEALERGGEYFWRVRALAAGSEGEASEVRSFRVVPLGVDVGFSTIDAGQTLIGTPSIGDGLIVNVGSSTVRLDSATTPSGTAFTVITGLTNVALAPNEELPVNVRFTPRASGADVTSVRVFYKDGQQQARNVQFENILRGKASALRVDAVEFEAVRVGRRALKAVRLINVSSEPLTLTELRIIPVNGSPASRFAASAFTLDAFANGVLPAGDTTFVTVRCLSMQEADLNAVIAATWRVGASPDSARVSLRANVRFVNPNNPSVVLGIRPRRDTVAPGTDVPLEIFIAEGNPDALLQAAQPLVRLRVAFDAQVLTLVGGARQLRTSAGSTESTVQLQTQWDRRTGLVVATINCRAVAGLRDTTALRIVGAEWGGGAERLLWEQSVVVEEPLDGKFTTRVSRAGGKRLIGAANAPTLVEIRPNPANTEAEIFYVLAKADDVELTLVNGNGALVQRLFSGMQEAGEYSIRAVLKGVSSGTYRVLLRTKNGTESATMNVVK